MSQIFGVYSCLHSRCWQPYFWYCSRVHCHFLINRYRFLIRGAARNGATFLIPLSWLGLMTRLKPDSLSSLCCPQSWEKLWVSSFIKFVLSSVVGKPLSGKISTTPCGHTQQQPNSKSLCPAYVLSSFSPRLYHPSLASVTALHLPFFLPRASCFPLTPLGLSRPCREPARAAGALRG